MRQINETVRGGLDPQEALILKEWLAKSEMLVPYKSCLSNSYFSVSGPDNDGWYAVCVHGTDQEDVRTAREWAKQRIYQYERS